MAAMDMLGLVIAVVTNSTYDWCAGAFGGYLLRDKWLFHSGVMRAALLHENALGWVVHYSVILSMPLLMLVCLGGFNYPPRLLQVSLG